MGIVRFKCKGNYKEMVCKRTCSDKRDVLILSGELKDKKID